MTCEKIIPWSGNQRPWTCRKADAWCNDPSGEPRDPLGVAPRFRNDEDMLLGIDRISRDERRAYRKRILCYSNDRRLVSWHTLPACVGRGVAFAPSYHTCFRNKEARNRMSPCVSANIMFLQLSSGTNNSLKNV